MLDTFLRMLGLPDDVPSQVTDMLGGGVGLLECAVPGRWPAVCWVEAGGLGLVAVWTDCMEGGLLAVETCLTC